MNITAKNVRTLPNGVHCLERSVYLRVNGEKRQWIFKYQRNGVRREMGLGNADQTLDGVRGKAAVLKSMLANGRDPYEERHAEKRKVEEKKVEVKKAAAEAAIPTFREFYPKALDRIERLRQWSNKTTYYKWESILRRYACAGFGDVPVHLVTMDMVEATLLPNWETSTGQLLQSILKTMFDVAIQEGHRTDNPAVWVGGLCLRLPSPAVLRRGKPANHHAAVPANTLKEIVKALRETETISAACLLFGILTVGRSNEFRSLEWDEVDFNSRTIAIPPARRKDKKPEPFIVPLSRQAVTLLKSLPVTGKYVFSPRGNKPIDRTTLEDALRRLTVYDITVHGTRSTFSDWCMVNSKNFIVSEKCLMHAVGNSVFRAYQRDDLLAQRAELLQQWADYLWH